MQGMPNINRFFLLFAKLNEMFFWNWKNSLNVIDKTTYPKGQAYDNFLPNFANQSLLSVAQQFPPVL